MLRAVLLSLLAGAAMPAQAADLATLGCVTDKLELPVRAQIVLDVERNLAESGKKHSYAPRVLAAVRTAATACAAEHGWPEPALRPAMLYTLATLGWPTAQKVAAERGLDTAALEEAWNALPEETRNRPLTSEANQQLAEASGGGDDQSPEKAELVGEFFGYLNLMQFTSYDFSQA
ncbi:MAG: hypothetical protein V4574_11695 [Pseudomonadota bacterium]